MIKRLVFLVVLASCGGEVVECMSDNCCGDNVINVSEECDGSDVGGETCGDHGYVGGELSCGRWCHYDESDCVVDGCLDGRITGSEQCDGNDLNGETCTSIGFGFTGGFLACNNWCGFDITMCHH
jgi:hypothetical protein